MLQGAVIKLNVRADEDVMLQAYRVSPFRWMRRCFVINKVAWSCLRTASPSIQRRVLILTAGKIRNPTLQLLFMAAYSFIHLLLCFHLHHSKKNVF